MQELDPASTVDVKPRPQGRGGIGAAVGLFLLAPLVAEFLLGNLPIKLLPAMIVLAPLYGGGALLIRELTRRSGRGWPTMLLLGMAYALFEEAFTTQSLFNRDYLHMHAGLLEPGYMAPLGIGGWWTLWMLNVHAVWSISTPIALVEACIPGRERTPWLGRVGLAVTAVVFVLGSVANAAISYRQDHFVASPLQFAGAAVAIAALILFAFRVPPVLLATRPSPNASLPTPLVAGLFALLAGSAALLVPMHWGWGAAAALLALDLIVLGTVSSWARSDRWSTLHTLALASGAALAYGWHAFLQHPAVGPLDSTVRVGNALFLLGAIAMIFFAWRKQTASVQAQATVSDL